MAQSETSADIIVNARPSSFLLNLQALGTIIGPMIGGYLAQPAEQYPEMFGNWPFLKAYPYFLPCFVAGMTNVSAVILGFIYLEEVRHIVYVLSHLQSVHLLFRIIMLMSCVIFFLKTLESKANKKNKQRQINSDELHPEELPLPDDQAVEGPPTFRALFTPTVVTVLLSFLFLALQNSSWATLIPLFAYTSAFDVFLL